MDRRVEVTQERLVKTLRHLMQRYAWEKISVSMICQEANIARSTFYAQFSSREELLALSIAHLAHELELADPSRGIDRNGTFRFLEPFLHHVKSHRMIYQQNLDTAAVGLIFSNLRQIISSLIAAELAQSSRAQVSDSDQTAFLCGGIFEMIDRWNADAYRQPVSDLLQRLDQLTRKLL